MNDRGFAWWRCHGCRVDDDAGDLVVVDGRGAGLIQRFAEADANTLDRAVGARGNGRQRIGRDGQSRDGAVRAAVVQRQGWRDQGQHGPELCPVVGTGNERNRILRLSGAWNIRERGRSGRSPLPLIEHIGSEIRNTGCDHFKSSR